MKKLNAFLLLLGLLFLIVLIRRTGIGAVWHELLLLGWGFVPLMISEGLAELFHAIGWRYCLIGANRSISIAGLFGISMAGYSINFLTPTASVGGDVTKAALLARRGTMKEAVTGVLIGKVSFALSHLFLVVLGALVILPQLALPRPLYTALLLSSGLLAFGIITFLLIQKHGKLGALFGALTRLRIGANTIRRLSRSINQVDESLRVFYRERPWDLPVSVLWHLLGYSLGIFQTWYFLRLLSGGCSLPLAAAAWSIGMWFDLVSFAVPLSLGVLEGSRMVALRAIGCSAVLGVTYGLTLRLTQLFWATFGLANYALLISKKTGSRTEAIPQPQVHHSAPLVEKSHLETSIRSPNILKR